MSKKMICINSYTDSWIEADYFDEDYVPPQEYEYECAECNREFLSRDSEVARSVYNHHKVFCPECADEGPC